MPIIDANVILRYLLGDHPDMSAEAREIVLSGAQTTAEVLAEVVYVLKGVYQVERSDIAETVRSFLREVSVPHKAAMSYACRLYGETKLDFVDCMLAGYHFAEGADVLTFDKKLNNIICLPPLDNQ